MSILKILAEVSDTASRNEKEAILTRNADNATLQKVFVAAYNPFINYYIKKIPAYKRNGENKGLPWALEQLKDLSSRKVTGGAASDHLLNVLESLHEYDAEVIHRIIDRDLRIGCSDSTANKVWPGLIPTFDVMLAHKDISRITFPCYGQIKFDGARCHLYWDGKHATAFARSGKEFELHGKFDADLDWLNIPAGTTLDGELLCVRDGKVLDRKTGNGILNKANKGTITEEDADLIVFQCWDVVDVGGTIPYRIRYGALKDTIKNSNKILLAETVVINNQAEAQAFFEKCIDEGHEGAMMKNMDNIWEPKRVRSIGKMKAEETADLKIVDWEEGTGKNEGRLGAYVCETEDGLLRVNVGIGFSDEDRDNILPNGTIISVKYNQLITSKGKETASLFLPRFEDVRFDKKKANLLSELK